MTDAADKKKQTRQFTVEFNTLTRFSFCTQKVKIELLRRHCYSLCCNSLWSGYKADTAQRLRVCHNDILKSLLRRPR